MEPELASTSCLYVVDGWFTECVGHNGVGWFDGPCDLFGDGFCVHIKGNGTKQKGLAGIDRRPNPFRSFRERND